jgi:CTP synthase (UTP-ammonia lyase)
MEAARIGLVGDFNPEVTAHQAIPEALRLAAAHLDRPVEPVWVGTATLDADVPRRLAGFAGIWCVPASPYANTGGALAAIRFARESGRPFLGTCGGFQHALLEYARNILGLHQAEHGETRPQAEMPLIAPLACALVERSGTVNFAEGSRLRQVYGAAAAREPYHCSYGLNPRCEKLLEGSDLRVCARDDAGEVRAVELAGHPFFLATLYQPERAALRGESHPLVNAFVAAVVAEKVHSVL